MELTLTPKVEALLQEKMSSGRFHDTSELIETALHALADSGQLDRSPLDAFIQEGLDSADRGDLYTEEEARSYIAELRAKL